MATASEKSDPNIPAQESPKKTLDPTVSATDIALDQHEDQPNDANVQTSEPAARSGTVESRKDGDDSKSAIATVGSPSGDDCAAFSIQKKIRRAERFGITLQLTEEEKRNSRAERFGTGSPLNGSETLKKSEEHKRKARAERFGLRDLSVVTDEEMKKKATSDEVTKQKATTDVEAKKKATTDEEAKKKARLARFAPVSKTDALEEEKRKARMIRFSSSPSNSLSQVNGKGDIAQNAAITSETGGGA